MMSPEWSEVFHELATQEHQSTSHIMARCSQSICLNYKTKCVWEHLEHQEHSLSGSGAALLPLRQDRTAQFVNSRLPDSFDGYSSGGLAAGTSLQKPFLDQRPSNRAGIISSTQFVFPCAGRYKVFPLCRPSHRDDATRHD
jgi:hypothetical protein